MTPDFSGVFDAFLRSSLLLTISALVVWAMLRVIRSASPLTHRAGWGCVLLCGVLIVQMSLEVPWYDPDPTRVTAVATSIDELPDLAGSASAGHQPLVNSRVETAPITAASSVNWRTIFLVAWVAGMLATLALSMVSYGLLLASLKRATVAPAGWQRPWRRLLRTQGVRARIPLLVHPRLGPMLCRLPRGYVVVVPEDSWTEFTPQERLAILRHELAHFLRGDVWTSLVARLLAVPHWFNPLAWWAVRKFEEGGEWACDKSLLADPHQVPAFARALLTMSRPASNGVCTSSARGSSLSVRLQRLLSFQVQEDSLMKRSLMCGVLICLVCGGLLRVHLVARAQDGDPPTDRQPQSEQRIAEFAGQLQGDGLMAKFKAALATPAGKIVLRDHTSVLDEQLRNQAQTNALPTYLKQHFVQASDGSLQLQDSQAGYRQEFLTAVTTFNTDIGDIEDALQNLSARITGMSEADRLLVRFMNHEAGPTMLYIAQLRERLRPDVRLVERLLGEVFVLNADGKYIIRPGRREEAGRQLQRLQKVRKLVQPIRDELKVWSGEFVEKDDFHKRIKRAMAEPLFASFLASELIKQGNDDPSQKLEQFFERLGDIAVDTADGLEIVDGEPREQMADALELYARVLQASKKLSAPMKSYASKIDGTEELERGWQQILSAEIVIVRLGGEYEFANADVGKVLGDLLSEVLSEGDDGKLAVRDDRAEEITAAVREMFRQYRNVRRRGRTIDELAAKVSDAELREAFLSPGGKYVVLHSIQDSLRGAQFDGLAMWVSEHFQETDSGLRLRDGHEEMLNEFLADVAELNEELKKDDF